MLRVLAEYMQRVVIESFEPKNQEMSQSPGVLDDMRIIESRMSVTQTLVYIVPRIELPRVTGSQKFGRCFRARARGDGQQRFIVLGPHAQHCHTSGSVSCKHARKSAGCRELSAGSSDELPCMRIAVFALNTVEVPEKQADNPFVVPRVITNLRQRTAAKHHRQMEFDIGKDAVTFSAPTKNRRQLFGEPPTLPDRRHEHVHLFKEVYCCDCTLEMTLRICQSILRAREIPHRK